MEAEAVAYETLGTESSLTALFDILPAWCLQNRIELVSGAWWDDCAVMSAIIDALHARFVELDFGVAVCQYFLESCYEALDAYHRDLSSEPCPWSEFSVPELIAVIREERERQPSFETDGYTSNLPTWLISKEQLIWNIWVCALYGPASARPLLVDSPDLLASQGYAGKTDVITELAQTSFLRYTTDRIASQTIRSTLPSRACRPICATPPSPTSAAFTASWRHSATRCCPQAAATLSAAWPPLPQARWNAWPFWSTAAGCANDRRPAGATAPLRTWSASAAPTWCRGRSFPTAPRSGTARPCAAFPAFWPA